MDDTVEIRTRLGRIGALAEAGAGRRELLREVRGLLEEGERTLRDEPRAEVRRAIETADQEPAAEEQRSQRLGARAGEEAAVS
jgi:hypothetical protein